MGQSYDTITAIGHLQAALALADDQGEFLLAAAIANALAIAERTVPSDEPHRWTDSPDRR